jgi:raffinose/stachyose/melibiose transport system permease protein
MTMIKFVKYSILTFATLLIMLPLLWLLMTSLKTNGEIRSNPLAFPTTWKFVNYADAWHAAKVNLYFFNTLLYCCVSVAIVLFISAAASFAFAKLPTKLTNILYPFLLSGTMIPIISIIIPLYFLLSDLKLLNSYSGIILVYTASCLPFAILILTAFLRTMPTALAESATMDGCTAWGVFLRIYLPLTSPALVTVGITTFIRLWNDILISLVLNSKSSFYTLGVGLKSFVGEHSVQLDQLSAGLILSILLPILLFIMLQKWIVEGLTSGAVKG